MSDQSLLSVPGSAPASTKVGRDSTRRPAPSSGEIPQADEDTASIFSVALSEYACAASIGPKSQRRRKPGDTQVWALSILSNRRGSEASLLDQLASLKAAPSILSLQEPSQETLPGISSSGSVPVIKIRGSESDAGSQGVTSGKTPANEAESSVYHVPVEGKVGPSGDDVFVMLLECARWTSEGAEQFNIVLNVTADDVVEKVVDLAKKCRKGEAEWQVEISNGKKKDTKSKRRDSSHKFLVRTLTARLTEAIQRESTVLEKVVQAETRHKKRFDTALKGGDNEKVLEKLRRCRTGRFTNLYKSATAPEVWTVQGDINQRLSDAQARLSLLEQVNKAFNKLL